MPRRPNVTSAQETAIRAAHERGEPYRVIARSVGVSPGAVVRTLARARLRTASEFKGAVSLVAPRRNLPGYSWDLEAIRGARDDQMLGIFSQPVRLAEAMRTDDALFTAYHNRLAPQSAIGAELISCGGTRGDAAQRKALASVIAPRTVLTGIHGTLANHGLAIGYNERDTADDGTAVHMRLTEWPLEFVRWNNYTEQLETRVRDGGAPVPIVHGDGTWTVFRKFHEKPWTQEACLLPGALIWASHANGVRDWASSSMSHGQAKIMGELPAGVALQNENGLTPEARMFLSMLQDMISGEMGAGIRPAGAKTDFLANGSTAWQVFSELIMNREKAAARVYLGTDAMLGSQGGAPGVDIATLFGVASTKIQGDLWAIETGLRTGLYEPWTAINFGDSRYAPALVYQMPDPDAEQRSTQQAAKRDRLSDTIKRMKEEGFVFDQSTVDKLATEYSVFPVPQLAAGDKKVTPLTLAPTDVAKVVRVREARASQGLEPFGDERDNMTITELDESLKAKATAPAT